MTRSIDTVTIRKEFHIDASPEAVWDALRDIGALHTRLVRGFVTDTRLEGQDRIVTFGNGMVARERIFGIDEAARRVTYGAVDGVGMSFHRATAEVTPDPAGGTRFVWTAEVAPPEIAERISPMMDAGAQAMQRTLAGA